MLKFAIKVTFQSAASVSKVISQHALIHGETYNHIVFLQNEKWNKDSNKVVRETLLEFPHLAGVRRAALSCVREKCRWAAVGATGECSAGRPRT